MNSQDSTLDRVLRSLNHPVRRQILRSLADHPGSATSLAQEFEMGLSSVSYHLNRVLAEDCNAVDLIKMIPRRGSVEKIYVPNKRLWSDFGWSLIVVDENGWEEIREARDKFTEQLEAAVKASRKRGQEKPRKTHAVIVGPAAFPAADSS